MFKVSLAGLLFSVFSVSLLANDTSYDYATVLDVEPIVKQIRITTPREECWQEEVVYRESYGNHHARRESRSLLGAVLGGALGNAVGHSKRNKQVGTVVGAVLGASFANSTAANRYEPVRETYGTRERCEIIHASHQEQRRVGYIVRYRYNNEVFTTRMDRDPGHTLKVRLSVSPVI